MNAKSACLMDLPVEAVGLQGRHRQRLEGIEALAASIAEVGLLHPIVVTPAHQLVAGGRRHAAFCWLGRATIPALVVPDLENAAQLLRAEAAENTCRKRLLPSEAVTLAEALLPYAREAARQRQGSRTDLGLSGKLPEGGEAMEKIAAAVGLSRNTLTRARRIVAAATEDAVAFGDLVEAMDQSGKVQAAYQELLWRKGQSKARKSSERCTLSLDQEGALQIRGNLGRAELLARLREFLDGAGGMEVRSGKEEGV